MNWWGLSILLLGGLAIFLHGMNVMTDGLKAVAGSRLKSFLRSMTHNRWTSLLAGTGITAVIQSSSVTTVLAVGFVSAGLLSFESTLGLILGANIGTTITAQIIAFKITKAAWLMVAFGYLFKIIFSKKSFADFGTIVLGLGLVFLGMNVMSEATDPLKDYEPFIKLMQGLENPLWGILIGTLFTAAIQSSSATTGIVIILASQDLVSVEAGIALILGANIGTCITALLSAIGKPRAALRVAVSHVFFKVAGVLIWFFFIGELAQFVQILSGGNAPREIANAHTVFNVANTIVFIWLVKPVSKLVLWLVPEEKKDEKQLFPKLHSYYLENISIALDLSQTSIVKLGDETLKIIESGLNIALFGNTNQLLQLRNDDEIIDKGHGEIIMFLREVQSKEISKSETKQLAKQLEAVNVLEIAADLITTDLVEASEHRIKDGFMLSEITINKLTGLYTEATHAFRFALDKFSGNTTPGKSEMMSKSDFKEHFLEVRKHLMQRLSGTDDQRIAVYRFESEVMEAIRRLHSLSRRLERKAE